MKLSIAVSMMVIACSLAAENRKIDESQQYKNHRISVNNDTLNHAAHKYPVYPSQVYANLSNVNDIPTAGRDQSRKTVAAAGAEVPSDVVRVFVTAIPNKHISNKLEHAASATASVAQSSNYYKTSSPPSVHLVTSKVVGYATTMSSINNNINNRKDAQKSPVYSSPALTADFRAAEEELTRRKSFNGTTKTRRVLRTQSQVQPNMFYVATTTTTQPKIVQNNPQRNATSLNSGGGTKLANSSNASKPFTTVLVPKQMLDGADYVQRDENSFRPIAPPVQFSYQVPQTSVPLDSNSIDSRRVTFGQQQANWQQNNVQLVAATTASTKQHAYMKPSAVYKVQEYGSVEEHSPVVSDRNNYILNSNNNNNIRDRTNVQLTYNAPSEIEKQSIKRDPPKYDKPQQHDVKYGFTVSESFKYDKQPFIKSSVSSDQQRQQFREYYPATTEAQTHKSPIIPYLPYNSAGKFESSSGPSKVFSSPPTTWFKQQPFTANTEKESGEFSMNDAKAKDMLKSLLHDLIKSKQQGETKTSKPIKSTADHFHEYYPELTDSSTPEFGSDDVSGKDVLYESLLRDMIKSKQQGDIMSKSGMSEIIDAYFKTNRPNADLNVDSYDIDTGKSFAVKSFTHILPSNVGNSVTIKF